MNGEAFSIRDAAAFIAAIDAELEQLGRDHVDQVRKGRLSQREADYVIGLIRDIRSDLMHAFGPLEIGVSYERPDAAVSWPNKVRWIKGELERRQAEYPEAVTKLRMTEGAAKTGIKLIATLRRLYWQELFMWDAEPGPALEFQKACRRIPPASAADLEAHAGGRALYRELVRKHVEAVELEEGGQGRLVA